MREFRLVGEPIEKLLVLLMAFAGLACGAEQKAPVFPNHNVVLILIDTLRADHLSLYGYERETTPSTDAFAREGIVFENARSQAACTYPSANSLLTSKTPIRFLGQASGSMGIPEDIQSIAEILHKEGYETVAVSGSPVVIDKPNGINGQGGYGRGFSRFDICECEGDGCSWRYKPHAACLNRKAMDQISERGDTEKPLFLYLHFMDPHGPYYPPGEEFIVYGSDYEGERNWVPGVLQNQIEKMIYSGGEPFDVKKEDLDHLINLYDDEIRYFDGQFAKLIEEMKSRKIWDETIFILVSDHGEEFMDHQSIKHCHTLYDSEIRIPFIVRLPGSRFAGRNNELVENLDVLPTVLDYLGVNSTELALDGHSLRPIIEAGKAVRAYSFSSQNTLRSIADDRYKLIYDIASKKEILFDLQEDPREEHDISSNENPHQTRLMNALHQWLVEVEGNDSATSTKRAQEISKETEEKLRAIGYIE
jgi:arylsulfatase A-like enzyme